MRLLWWAVLALGAVWLLRRVWRASRPAQPPASPDRDAPDAPRRMVRCAHCGVHLAEDEAVVAQGLHFCDAAHRDAGAAPGA
jgi:uncharacterized protein